MGGLGRSVGQTATWDRFAGARRAWWAGSRLQGPWVPGEGNQFERGEPSQRAGQHHLRPVRNKSLPNAGEEVEQARNAGRRKLEVVGQLPPHTAFSEKIPYNIEHSSTAYRRARRPSTVISLRPKAGSSIPAARAFARAVPHKCS
jgi:hypothetical protein